MRSVVLFNGWSRRYLNRRCVPRGYLSPPSSGSSIWVHNLRACFRHVRRFPPSRSQRAHQVHRHVLLLVAVLVVGATGLLAALRSDLRHPVLSFLPDLRPPSRSSPPRATPRDHDPSADLPPSLAASRQPPVPLALPRRLHSGFRRRPDGSLRADGRAVVPGPDGHGHLCRHG